MAWCEAPHATAPGYRLGRRDTLRAMKIHEFQASALLAQSGVPVPPGRAIESVVAAAGAY